MAVRPVYIAIGSNLDGPERQLKCAINTLKNCAAFTSFRTSSLFWTPPLGPKQPQYLNGAIAAESNWEPECLLALLHCVEHNQGRDRTESIHWGPRVLDLDLLMVGEFVIDSPTLKIPHPEMTKRRFVLDPLCELVPNAIHPTSGRTIEELQRALCD